MRTKVVGNSWLVGKAGLWLSLAMLFPAPMLRAQLQPGPVVSSSNVTWQQAGWLKSSSSDTVFNATSGQDIKDPATVLATGSLWQEKSAYSCTRKMDDGLTLTCETSRIAPTSGPNPFLTTAGAPTFGLGADGAGANDLYREQKAGLLFQPLDTVTLSGNVHDSTSDFTNPAAPTVTTGAGFSAQTMLPLNSTLKLDLNSDRSGSDLGNGAAVHDTTWDAQFQQPLGQVPLTAMVKGHYEEISETGSPAGRAPSMEQSLVWKPIQETTLQAGLRQQQYQEYPGVSDELNQALFADWNQNLAPTITWHSYAEMMNSKSLANLSASPAPQSAAPGSNPSLTSSMPVSLDTETLTFTTGPAFKLQDDLSASIEYSSRWDKNPQPGDLGEEQRISVSLKGSF